MTIRISLVTLLVALAFLAIGAVGAVGVMLLEPWSGDGAGGGTRHTLTGTVLLIQDTSVLYRRGDTCQGEGAFSDMRSGTQVLITDNTGALLETGGLTPGTVKLAFHPIHRIGPSDRLNRGYNPEGLPLVQPGRVHCEFSFEILGIPEADFYSIEVGRRDPLTLSRRELETNAWTLQIELGN